MTQMPFHMLGSNTTTERLMFIAESPTQMRGVLLGTLEDGWYGVWSVEFHAYGLIQTGSGRYFAPTVEGRVDALAEFDLRCPSTKETLT